MANFAALIGAIAALIGAIAALIRQIGTIVNQKKREALSAQLDSVPLSN
jgi:hypothetical protein